MEVLSGRYEVGDVVYRDASVAVYRGHDRVLNRPVTIERLQPQAVSPATIAALQDKARRMALAELPNMAALYDQGEEQGQPYLVTEELQGAPLVDVAPLAPHDVVALVTAVGATVRAAQRTQTPLPPLDGQRIRYGDGRTQIVAWGVQPPVAASADPHLLAPILALAATGTPAGDGAAGVPPALRRIVAQALGGQYASSQALEDDLRAVIVTADDPTVVIPRPRPTIVLGQVPETPPARPASPAQATRAGVFRRPSRPAAVAAPPAPAATSRSRRGLLPLLAGVVILAALLGGGSWIRGRTATPNMTAGGVAGTAATSTAAGGPTTGTNGGKPFVAAPAGTTRLNVRSGPGESYPVVGKLTTGDRVQVVEGPVKAGGRNWAHIQGNGVDGWCVFEALRPQ